ncbi:MAG TPA: hypothetical protein VJ508_18330, partial [Saprospiraceae bacterium]|nr:hypothetical protein [Saprospiraceae bacterium]
MKANLLIVTDHRTHTETNSMYGLAMALKSDPRCGEAWVVSKGMPENESFFSGIAGSSIWGIPVDDHFTFQSRIHFFSRPPVSIGKKQVGAILIRTPQPIDPVFLVSLSRIVPENFIINQPSGIIETATKSFLTRLSHLCPLPKLVNSAKEALELSFQYELVLKPLYSYGGKGLIRISPDHIWRENSRFPISEAEVILGQARFPMLSMRFLKNVVLGDKRTIVINKELLASAIRLPAPGHWVCNVAQGGHAVISSPDENEFRISNALTPMLFDKGIFMYGFDTLVDDDGRRVLSEINTLSIGGLLPMEEMSGKPLIRQ